MEKKLDFLIIGTQKAGTTALAHYLTNHRKIEIPRMKELHFFDNETLFLNPKIDYDYYENHFENFSTDALWGEATPIYLYWEPACRRIWEYNKDIKLVAILRNPIERAFSHWNMEYCRRNETKDFSFCIIHEVKRSRGALPLQHRIYSYLDRGFYSEQIRRYRRYFEDKQLLFIKYDDFRDDHQNVLNRLLDFLGVGETTLDCTPRFINKINYVRNLSKKEKLTLLKLFQNEIKEIERLLNWDCRDWMKVTD